jgi:uncharacterized damage-inducible protein DinB
MTAFFTDLIDRFAELHADLAKAVDGLPVEALDWSAAPGINSICVLVVHLTGAERYWLGDVAGGDASGRVRAEEFGVHGLTAGELKARITTSDVYARQTLARFSLAELEADRKSARNDRTFSVGWCLMHALEHSALHLGHVQLTRQLWEQKEQRVAPAPIE